MNPLRLWRIYRAANRTLDVLDEGAKDWDSGKPTVVRLYKRPAWWLTLLRAAREFALVIPLPLAWQRAVKVTDMNNLLLKLGIFAGVAVEIAHALGKLPLPPKAGAIVGGVAAIAAVVAGVLHPSPTQPAQP